MERETSLVCSSRHCGWHCAAAVSRHHGGCCLAVNLATTRPCFGVRGFLRSSMIVFLFAALALTCRFLKQSLQSPCSHAHAPLISPLENWGHSLIVLIGEGGAPRAWIQNNDIKDNHWEALAQTWACTRLLLRSDGFLAFISSAAWRWARACCQNVVLQKCSVCAAHSVFSTLCCHCRGLN